MDQYLDYDIILTPKSSNGKKVVLQNRSDEVPCVEFSSNTRIRKNSAYNVMGICKKNNKKLNYCDKYKKPDQEKRQYTLKVQKLKSKNTNYVQAM